MYPTVTSFTSLFEDLFDLGNQSVRYNVDEDKAEVSVYLPGKEQDDIELAIDVNGFGAVTSKKGKTLARFRLSPLYNLENAEAKMKGGVLTVKALRKISPASAKRIPISC